MAGLSTLQSRIDGIAYPPTHTYRLEGLVPTGILAQRVRIIEEIAPDLFDCEYFLDVGANKGYFTLRAAQTCKVVHAIEPDAETCRLLRDICPDNVRVNRKTFMELDPYGPYRVRYDRIFIGNGPHYLFREAQGWKWVEHLSRLSRGTVVMEGPTGMECQDMQRTIPENLKHLFNRAALMEAMGHHFTLAKITPSPGYTPDRYIMRFELDDELVRCNAERMTHYARYIYHKIGEFTEGRVLEVCTRHDRGTMTPDIIPHDSFVMVDKDPQRPGLNLNAVTDELPECDCLISLAILHHTAPKHIPTLIANLVKNTKLRVILNGPNVEALPELFGDHQYHINVDEINLEMAKKGFRLIHSERVGFSQPYCEVLLAYER